MNANSDGNNFGKMVLPLCVGVISAIAVCMVLLIIFAAILSGTDFDDSSILIAAFISQAAGAVSGGFISAKIYQKNGLIMGAVCGLIMFLLLTLLSLVFGGGTLGAVTLIKLATVTVGGIFGGIMGVNLKRRKKVI